MKTKSTAETSWKKLKPLAVHIAANRGTLQALCDEIKKRTGETYHRNVVCAWIETDEGKRRKCFHGIGIVLCDIARAWKVKGAK